MPPRFAYWTILIDDKPTAFRAREQQELLPTLTQLRRTNPRVELKWFAQGRLWESPEAQHAAGRRPTFTGEKRGVDWRPGGQHKDPRARFDKEARRRQKREQRAEWNVSREREPQPRENRPAGGWPRKPPREGQRPWADKPPREGQRPWTNKPPREGQRPWSGKPRGDKPWQNKPPREGQRPWSNKPPRDDRRPPSGAKPPDHRRRRRDEPPDHE